MPQHLSPVVDSIIDIDGVNHMRAHVGHHHVRILLGFFGKILTYRTNNLC